MAPWIYIPSNPAYLAKNTVFLNYFLVYYIYCKVNGCGTSNELPSLKFKSLILSADGATGCILFYNNFCKHALPP